MDPNTMTEFMGYQMTQRDRSMIIDLLVASVMIFFIMLPAFCFKAENDDFNPKNYIRKQPPKKQAQESEEEDDDEDEDETTQTKLGADDKKKK